MDLPSGDVTSLLAYPGFVLISIFGANMMKRQRDIDKRQTELAETQMEMSKQSLELVLGQSSGGSRTNDLEREVQQLREDLRWCRDERDRLRRDH
jgi:hypothetical protein